MEAREFYDKRLNENPDISSVQLMEEYAKHIIEINFCDASPVLFDELTVKDMKKINRTINSCVEWVNS